VQRLLSQRRRVARDCDLADTLDAWHTTVERCDEFMQATKSTRSIRVVGDLPIGHQNSLELASSSRLLNQRISPDV
jgi:hypothetical protein